MTAKNGNISLILKLALAAVVVVAVGFVAWQRFSDIANVQPVIRGKAVSAVPGSVKVTADKGIREFKSEVAGRVLSCEALDPGKSFKKGDVLLQLDTTELVRELKLAEEDFASRQAKRKLLLETNQERVVAKDLLDNATRLEKRGDVSAETVKGYTRALQALDDRAAIEEFDNKKAKTDFDNAIETKRILLRKMSLVAQEDGVVDGVLVAPGALIRDGQSVATIFSNERVVIAKISEEKFGGIKLGQPAKVRLLIYGSEPPFDAKVSKIIPTADEATQLYSVYLDVAVDPIRLPPGSNGQATITVGERENQLLIPRRAIFSGNNVFVVKNSRVEQRKLSLGFLDLNKAEVLEGLKEGEMVIVDNIDQFHDGQRVRLPAAK